MATKQVIEINVTWEGWSKLRISHLLNYLANLDKLSIERISVREVKKTRKRK
jgi:hypothetical protein